MKLIDAEQCPCYKCGATCPYNSPVGDCKKFSCWILGTAYDVDSVVEELNYIEMKWDKSCPPHNECGEPMCDVDCVECQIRRCKDIVKRGGVDD